MSKDYQQAKIYKIVCNVTGLQYVGATCKQYLSQRLTKHRVAYKQWKQGKGNFVTSFKVLENDNYEIVLLESYPCNNIDELNARERCWIEREDCVNKVIPGRTDKEYSKEYREVNRDSLLKKSKEHYEANKDYYKEYRETNRESILEKKREHYEANRERLAQHFKERYEANKESIAEKRKEKVRCECGSEVRKCDLPKHKRTKKHQEYIENISKEA